MNNLETLIKLIGEDQAERILTEGIQSRLGTQTRRVSIEKPAKVKSTNHGGARKHMDQETKARLIARAREDVRKYESFPKLSKALGQEFGMNPSTIYNLIYTSGLMKEING